jgi:hypothetical protein
MLLYYIVQFRYTTMRSSFTCLALPWRPLRVNPVIHQRKKHVFPFQTRTCFSTDYASPFIRISRSSYLTMTFPSPPFHLWSASSQKISIFIHKYSPNTVRIYTHLILRKFTVRSSCGGFVALFKVLQTNAGTSENIWSRIAGSNLIRFADMFGFLCIVLYTWGRGLAMGFRPYESSHQMPEELYFFQN